MRVFWTSTLIVIIGILPWLLLSGCQQGEPVNSSSNNQTESQIAPIETPSEISATQAPQLTLTMPVSTPTEVSFIPTVIAKDSSRGYQTTPGELREIAQKADLGIEPYASAVEDVLRFAKRNWSYYLREQETCEDADSPLWNDNGGGTPILLAKAMAYHITGDENYAFQVRDILERIMSTVKSITPEVQRCQLTFSWGTPELVSSADLIEDVLANSECLGPESTVFNENELVTGNCKELFQNWLVKNPYYIISLSAEESLSNWGAAATNALAYIADYLWDRPEVSIIHRVPEVLYGSDTVTFSPAEAFAHANQLAIDRMNGYRVELRSSRACDLFVSPQQNPSWDMVKSQISEIGIIPEDARREEYCNISEYNGLYQNYPQIHLGNNIQQCELMLRRGDSSCYDNIDESDIPGYTFVGADGENHVTHLYPGRGSIERAIKAIIVDSGTEWRHDSALEVAYHYYYSANTISGIDLWYEELIDGRPLSCSQDLCFGTLTHGFAVDELPSPVPMIAPP